jgi:hypothetical protein
MHNGTATFTTVIKNAYLKIAGKRIFGRPKLKEKLGENGS